MKRPTFLTFLLVLMATGYTYGMFIYLLRVALIFSATSQIILIPMLVHIVMAALELVAVYLLWTWKKIGFYLVVTVSTIGILFNFVTTKSLGMAGTVGIISTLIGLGILYLAIRPVWQNFK